MCSWILSVAIAIVDFAIFNNQCTEKIHTEANEAGWAAKSHLVITLCGMEVQSSGGLVVA